jgi:hypothetical protein
VKLTAEGVVNFQTTPIKSTTSTQKFVPPPPDQHTPRVRSKPEKSYRDSMGSAAVPEDANSPANLALPQGETEMHTNDVTDTPSDEVSVTTVPLDSPSEEDDEIALQKVLEENQLQITKGFSAFADLPPSTPKGPPRGTPSPTLIPIHSAFNSKLVNLDMSPMEGLPPGYAPPPVATGKTLINTKLTES